jgi:WD40 repeat protein
MFHPGVFLMKYPPRVLRLVALVPLLGLLGCGSRDGSAPNPQGPGGPGGPKGPGAVKPLFSLDTGLMDYWRKKKSGPTSMAVSPDGKFLLTMAMAPTGNVQVWDLDKQQRLYQLDDDSGTTRLPVAISPDGKMGAYMRLRKNDKPGVVLIDLPSGKEVRFIDGKKRRLHSAVNSLRFSPKGDLLVLANNQEIIGWDPATGNERFLWRDDARVNVLSQLFEDGKKIASMNEQATIKVWDVATGKPLQTLSVGNQTYDDTLAVSSDGKFLVSHGAQPFKFWDLPARTVVKEITESHGTYTNILVLPDNRTVVWNTKNAMVLYDLASGAKKQEVKAHEDNLLSLAVKADGSLLISAGDDALIKGWKVSASGAVE